MNEFETENEFEYIDLDKIDEKREEDDSYYDDEPVRVHKAADDQIFIVGTKL